MSSSGCFNLHALHLHLLLFPWSLNIISTGSYPFVDPYVIQYHTSRFIGAVKRRTSLHPPITFSSGSTNSNLKVSQRYPMDRIIYHFVTFGHLLLFVGLNIWLFFVGCFLDAFFKKGGDDVIKIILYPAMVIVLICIWIIAATGRLGEISPRWWPSRDYPVSRLLPPSIKNATTTKCRWTLLFYQS